MREWLFILQILILTKLRWGGVSGVGCRVWVRNSPNNQWNTSPIFSRRLGLSEFKLRPTPFSPTPYTLPPAPHTLLVTLLLVYLRSQQCMNMNYGVGEDAAEGCKFSRTTKTDFTGRLMKLPSKSTLP